MWHEVYNETCQRQLQIIGFGRRTGHLKHLVFESDGIVIYPRLATSRLLRAEVEHEWNPRTVTLGIEIAVALRSLPRSGKSIAICAFWQILTHWSD